MNKHQGTVNMSSDICLRLFILLCTFEKLGIFSFLQMHFAKQTCCKYHYVFERGKTRIFFRLYKVSLFALGVLVSIQQTNLVSRLPDSDSVAQNRTEPLGWEHSTHTAQTANSHFE